MREHGTQRGEYGIKCVNMEHSGVIMEYNCVSTERSGVKMAYVSVKRPGVNTFSVRMCFAVRSRTENTAVGIGHADHVAPYIRKSWH
jgi:hypothetical protein